MAANDAGGGPGEDMDFFEMLGIKTRNRMDEQRSQHIPDAEKPMVINFDLLKNQVAGGTIVVNTATTFPCYYMGHEPCHYAQDKERLCNELVQAKCEKSKVAKLSSVKNPFSSHVKCDADGIQFVLGTSGAATVNIDLSQVACVSLCPKKPGGALKVVAILCRSPRARENKKGVGELGMVLHMCRMKNNDAMWNFQRAFVDALKSKFPEYHKDAKGGKGDKPAAADKSPEKKKKKKKSKKGDDADDFPNAAAADDGEDEDGGDGNNGSLGNKGEDRRASIVVSPAEEISPVKATMPRAHRVFVKTKEEVLQRDTEIAQRIQREEETAYKTQAHTFDTDADLARALQEAEDAKLARQQQLSFDDEDPLSALPT
eukprot:m.171533 g.171533  ORF g.171533 m.171533 type:complete len:372 (+) comp13385_c0_seq1:60-1175(+)